MGYKIYFSIKSVAIHVSTKSSYIDYCHRATVPLFFQPYWLEASHIPWDVEMAQVEDHVAYWVFHLEKKKGFSFLRNPHLTPYSGVLFCEPMPDASVQKELAQKLFQQLPHVDVLAIDLPLNINPSWFLSDINHSLKRSNLLDLNQEETTLFESFKPALKRQIKKSQRSLSIFEADDVDLFYRLHSLTFKKQNQQPSISAKIYNEYWSCCKAHQCGRLFFIKDDQENIHASLWLAFDDDSAYYLAGGTDPSFYGSGAMSGLMWHAIQESKLMGKSTFDFEGSMLPSVDKFFKNFSPTEVTYLHLEKVNSPIYRLWKYFF